MPVGQVIAAILLPPLGVFLGEGVSRNFWIDLALTCFGYLPGIIFALVVLAKKNRTPQPAA
jgi:uncharacterized membrane protein YqaE (UPF0057 family)